MFFTTTNFLISLMYYPKISTSHGGEDRAWAIGVVAFGIDLNIAEAEGGYFEVVKITSNIISAERNEEEPILYTTYSFVGMAKELGISLMALNRCVKRINDIE